VEFPLIGTSVPFVRAVSKIEIVAASEGSVLISGETGTGKELVARSIHAQSRRSSGTMVAVNCGALPDTLFESEIFGFERGAFTGANARKTGLIAEAARGTLFLDEIDSLTPRAQVSLLRVLQDQRYRPLGATRECQADIRLIAASNVQLDKLIQEGRFRADLYYRVAVFTLCIPPLRERQEDIPLLIEYFISKFAPADKVPQLSESARRALLAYHWPGNVRELENVMQRAVWMASDKLITADSLGLGGDDDAREPELQPGIVPDAQEMMLNGEEVAPNGEAASFRMEKQRVIQNFEREYLTRLMTLYDGNVSRAARSAKKERRDLGKLLKRYALDPKKFNKAQSRI
jgi:transcriptional regulator with PAS, ATPase and Fis domain